MKLGSELTDEHRKKISKSCKGKKINNKNANKPILQFDMDGNFIKKWNSVTEASKGVNRAICSISLCVRGLVRHSAGYKWKYNEDEYKS